MPQGSPSAARQEHPRHPTQHAGDPELWGRVPSSTASSLPGLTLCTPAPTVQSPKDRSHVGARRCTEAGRAHVPLLRLGSGLALVAVLESRTGGSWGPPDSGKASAGLQGRVGGVPSLIREREAALPAQSSGQLGVHDLQAGLVHFSLLSLGVPFPPRALSSAQEAHRVAWLDRLEAVPLS